MKTKIIKLKNFPTEARVGDIFTNYNHSPGLLKILAKENNTVFIGKHSLTENKFEPYARTNLDDIKVNHPEWLDHQYIFVIS